MNICELYFPNRALVSYLQQLTLDLGMLSDFWNIYSVSDGNGFKTSTMRLGADVIVFSRSNRSGY